MVQYLISQLGTATTWEKQNVDIFEADYQYKMEYSFDLWSHGVVQNQTFVVPNNGNAVPKLAGFATYKQVRSNMQLAEAIQSETLVTKQGTNWCIHVPGEKWKFLCEERIQECPKRTCVQDQCEKTRWRRLYQDGNLVTQSVGSYQFVRNDEYCCLGIKFCYWQW
jgi:hypothetical protein